MKRVRPPQPEQPGPSPADAPDGRPDVPTLYRDHLDYVWHSLRRLGVPEKDVPDVAHDVFLAVARALPSYDPRRPIKPWMFGICFRVTSDQLRLYRNSREVLAATTAEAEPPDIAPSPEQRLLDGEARRLVEDCLARLDLPHRAVLIMHDIADHRAHEIADALDIPVKTVYSRLRAARLTFSSVAARLAAQRGLR